mgnify:CR=1 FL=1
MTKYFHIVQVHPVYNGILQTHKVRWEFEFETMEEADTFIADYNKGATDLGAFTAIYYGCVNDETGELV